MQDDAPEERPQDPAEQPQDERHDSEHGSPWPWPEAPDGHAAPSGEATAGGSSVEPGAVPSPEPTGGRSTGVDDAPLLDVALRPGAVPVGAQVALAYEGARPSAALTSADAPRPPNEAIPAVAPQVGTAPIGSIPAAHARAVWSRLQASNWRLFLIRFLCAGLAVVITVAIVPGLGFEGWRWGDFTRIAIIFGALNATVKPLLQFLVLRFIFSTYGVVVVIINALLLLLLGAILNDTFVVYRPISLLIGGLIVGIVGMILETLLGATPPVLDRDYKERNGLR
jgi:putative membrane protein